MKWYKVHARTRAREWGSTDGCNELGVVWGEVFDEDEHEMNTCHVAYKAEAWMRNKLTHEKQRGMAVLRILEYVGEDILTAEVLSVLEARDNEELPEGAKEISKKEASDWIRSMKKWTKPDYRGGDGSRFYQVYPFEG